MCARNLLRLACPYSSKIVIQSLISTRREIKGALLSRMSIQYRLIETSDALAWIALLDQIFLYPAQLSRQYRGAYNQYHFTMVNKVKPSWTTSVLNLRVELIFRGTSIFRREKLEPRNYIDYYQRPLWVSFEPCSGKHKLVCYMQMTQIHRSRTKLWGTPLIESWNLLKTPLKKVSHLKLFYFGIWTVGFLIGLVCRDDKMG